MNLQRLILTGASLCLVAVTVACSGANSSASGGFVAESVVLNNSAQRIYVKSDDTALPVLLWLDGGPGGSELAWVDAYLDPLRESFTVVCWDQRGTAGSWGVVKDKRKLRVKDYVDDVLALSELLVERYKKEQVYLVGHSWGSIIGVMAAAERPDLFAAYIGIGQQINSSENDNIGYDLVMEGARRAGDSRTLKRLEANGRPPYSAKEKGKYLFLFQKVWSYSPAGPGMGSYDSTLILKARPHRFLDRINLVRGLLAGVNYVYPQLADLDFERDIPRLDCPVFLANGRYDRITPSEIAARWFEHLDAPLKDLRWFPRSAHSPCYEESQAFIAYLRDVVLERTRP